MSTMSCWHVLRPTSAACLEDLGYVSRCEEPLKQLVILGAGLAGDKDNHSQPSGTAMWFGGIGSTVPF